MRMSIGMEYCKEPITSCIPITKHQNTLMRTDTIQESTNQSIMMDMGLITTMVIMDIMSIQGHLQSQVLSSGVLASLLSSMEL